MPGVARQGDRELITEEGYCDLQRADSVVRLVRPEAGL